MNLIDARYLNGRWKGIEATDVAGVSSRGRIDLTEMLVSPGVVGKYRTGVRRDRMDDWEVINAKDAPDQFCKMANSIFDSLTIASLEMFQTLSATNARCKQCIILMTGLESVLFVWSCCSLVRICINNIIGGAPSGMGEETICWQC